MTRAFQSEQDQLMLEALKHFSKYSQGTKVVHIWRPDKGTVAVDEASACAWALDVLEGEELATFKLAHLRGEMRDRGLGGLYKMIMGEDL